MGINDHQPITVTTTSIFTLLRTKPLNLSAMKFVISLAVLALVASASAAPGSLFTSANYPGLNAVQASIDDIKLAADDLGQIETQLKTLSDASATVASGETTIEAGVDNAILTFSGNHN